MAEKWKPKIHPVGEFYKFPWGRVGFEGMGPVGLNIQFNPSAAEQPRPVKYPREAFIQFFLDEPWLENEQGGSFRPYEIWLVPDGFCHLIDILGTMAKNDLRRGIKELLHIRDVR